MKQPTILLVLLATGLLPLGASASADASNPAPPATAFTPDSMLSRPARDVVKMTSSGVSDDVVKAYVDNSPTPFSLTADNIIHMQSSGVSSGVTSEMLTHDKKLSDQAAMNPPAMPPTQPGQPAYPYPPNAAPEAPEVVPQNTVSTYTIPADTSYYSDLAPYGSWGFQAGYGWCWQPSFGLGYAYYPWGLLRSGRWCNFPGRGWCWLPGRGGFNTFGGRGFVVGGAGFGGSRFAVNRGVSSARFGGFNGGRFGGFGGGVSVTHIGGSGFRSGGSSHFGGGGGGHFSGGAHFSGGHSFGGGGHR